MREIGVCGDLSIQIRNRLKYKRLHMIIYVRYNMKLKLRQLKRRGNNEIDASFDPINLDYTFDEDDPLNEWLEEREDPVFNGDDLSWLDLDDNDDDNNQRDNPNKLLGANPLQTSEPSRHTKSALSPPSSGGPS